MLAGYIALVGVVDNKRVLIDLTISSGSNDLQEAVMEWTAGAGVQVTLGAIGISEVFWWRSWPSGAVAR